MQAINTEKYTMIKKNAFDLANFPNYITFQVWVN